MKLSKNELFVSHSHDDSDIYEIFTTREEAVIDADIHNEEIRKANYSDYKKPSYKAMTLYDALEEIKDYIKDQEEIRFAENRYYTEDY